MDCWPCFADLERVAQDRVTICKVDGCGGGLRLPHLSARRLNLGAKPACPIEASPASQVEGSIHVRSNFIQCYLRS